jgi:hypothetical protein
LAAATAATAASLYGSLIQIGDKGVDVDAVSLSSLFDILKPGGGAAETAHTVITEYLDGFRVFLDHVDNTEIFGDDHEADPPF